MLWARGEYYDGLDKAMSYYLTFNGEFLGPGQPHGHVWTLGVEQKFYVLWPLVAFGIAMSAQRRAAVTAALLVVLVALCAVEGMFVSYAPIVVGCLLAIVLHSTRGFAVLATLTRPRAAPVVVVVFVLVHLAIPTGQQTLGDSGQVPLLYAGAVALLLVSLLQFRNPATWVLSRRLMVFAGERSYSLYLIQGVAGIAVAATVPLFATHRTLTALVVTTVGLLMADLLYRGVELPGIALGRRWIAGRRSTSQPLAAGLSQGR
jgi:peptidoglycan/LPS O-acetylase OafA/YrhL